MTASDPTPTDGPGDEHGTGERSVADLALDVLLFAPAGALLTAAADMPAMAAKGRERIEQELRNAHMVGRFVVDAGMRQVRGQLDRLAGERPAPGRPAAPEEARPPGPAPRAGGPAPRRAGARPAARSAGAGTERAPFTGASESRSAAGSAPAPEGSDATGAQDGAPARDPAVDRAIADYDTLSASQVVRRLDGLGPHELRAVVRHELANRGRRTILHRAEQLLGEAPPPAPPVAP